MYVIERTTHDTPAELVDVFGNEGDAARSFCRRIVADRNVERVAAKIAGGIAIMEREQGTSNILAVRQVRGYEYARQRLDRIRERLATLGANVDDTELCDVFAAAVDLATTAGTMIVDRMANEGARRG